MELEIRDELHANGGRVSASQLKEAINVDVSHVESKMKEIASKDTKVSLLPPHESEIITSWYLDNIVSDVESHLEQYGSSNVAKLAMRFDLPVDFLRSVLERHIGLDETSTIRGSISTSGMILTEASVRRLRAKLRGAFNGAAKPLALDKLATCLGVERKVITKEAKEMIDSGNLYVGVLSLYLSSFSVFYLFRFLTHTLTHSLRFFLLSDTERFNMALSIQQSFESHK